jgi:hypothetical protein
MALGWGEPPWGAGSWGSEGTVVPGTGEINTQHGWGTGAWGGDFGWGEASLNTAPTVLVDNIVAIPATGCGSCSRARTGSNFC